MYINSKTFLQIHDNGFYFRIFGYGISVDRNSEPLFSERAGITKPLYRHNQFVIRFLSRKDY